MDNPALLPFHSVRVIQKSQHHVHVHQESGALADLDKPEEDAEDVWLAFQQFVINSNMK